MNCPKCGAELATIVRGLYPVEQRDEVRVVGGEAEDGLQVEFTGEMEIRQQESTEEWLECPQCGQELEEAIPGGIEFVDSPTAACESVELSPGAEARGRNGWFTPSELTVQRSEPDAAVWVSVRSSRAYADMPPIWLSLCRDDAVALHRALGRQLIVLAGVRADEAVTE
jgi:predicted RNA-binding Zn-ribbon protein involved in translation (DUF1610 family)